MPKDRVQLATRCRASFVVRMFRSPNVNTHSVLLTLPWWDAFTRIQLWRSWSVKKDLLLQSTWPELSFSHAHRACDHISGPSPVRARRRATTSALPGCYARQAEGGQVPPLCQPSQSPAQSRSDRPDHPTATAGRRRDSRCGWGCWFASLSWSNWDGIRLPHRCSKRIFEITWG